MKYKFLVFFFMTFTVINCGKSDSRSDVLETQKRLLINNGEPWVVQSVIKDGYIVTDRYKQFSVSFNDGTYSIQNSMGDAWPKSSGTWQFADESGTTITRDDGTNLNVLLSESSLVITLSNSVAQGRMGSHQGGYIFNLLK